MRVDARRGASHSSSLEAAPSQTASFFDARSSELVPCGSLDLDQRSGLRGADDARGCPPTWASRILGLKAAVAFPVASFLTSGLVDLATR